MVTGAQGPTEKRVFPLSVRPSRLSNNRCPGIGPALKSKEKTLSGGEQQMQKQLVKKDSSAMGVAGS